MRAKASVALLLAVTLDLSGCYLGHLASGQTRLLRARRPLAEVLADSATAPELRRSLALVEEARTYATRLGLDVGEQYTSYVDWPGDRVVTTVVAAEPGSVEAAGFWFPIAGRVPYKGFFDPQRAEAEAERLRANGMDVCVSPIRAYSTLGWLDDPVTGPMVRAGDPWLIETVLHELVHATVYVRGQPDFNEGVASFIGEEASVRFFAEREPGAAAQRERVADSRKIDAALLTFRERVAALYAEQEPGEARERARAELETAARAALRSLPLTSRDPTKLAEKARLNDACLALAGTYTAHTAGLADVLDALDGDLARFVERTREAADDDDPIAALVGP